MYTVYIILGVLVVAIVWLVALFNGLVTLKNRVKEAWSDIDVQLKRRYNLIPNLIESVKGYAKHEAKVFNDVTEARTRAMGAKSPEEHARTENMLSQTLKSLFAVAENYPDLKASQNFLQLQDELSDTENKITASRRFYNGNVRDFNTKIQKFPNNLLANTLGFEKQEFFKIEHEAEKSVPKVKF